jgi:hypothetical protein
VLKKNSIIDNYRRANPEAADLSDMEVSQRILRAREEGRVLRTLVTKPTNWLAALASCDRTTPRFATTAEDGLPSLKFRAAQLVL